MDDFGTGYSSLSYLQKYPFNTIKIDRSFVNNFSSTEGATALLNAMLSLASDLNLQAVAEGVETQAQHNYLLDRECSFAQGYLYGKPMPPNDFYDLIKTKYEEQS